MNQRTSDPEPRVGRPCSKASDNQRTFSNWLIRRVARAAPAPLSERLQEEWLADLAERRSPFARLRFAVGCCWATRVIAFEHGAAVTAVPTSASGPKLALSTLQEKPPRRSIALMGVLLVHLLVLYAVSAGFGYKLHTHSTPPLQTAFLPAVRTPPPPPSVPPPGREKIDIEMPVLPEVPVGHDPDAPTVVLKPEPASALPTPLPSHASTVRQGGPGAGFPTTDDFYPSSAIRLGEQGASIVHVCVDPAGRLTERPTIEHSAGSVRLDLGAVALATAGSGHYLASTEDGRPVASCFSFKVRFTLKK